MTLTEYNQKLRSGHYMRRYFKVTGTCWGNLFPTTLEFAWDARGIVDFLAQPYIRDRFVHIDSVVETQAWAESEDE